MQENITRERKKSVKRGIVLACSGASDLGELTDKLARKLGSNGDYQMKCLAMVSADDKSLLASLQKSKTLVIDGCDLDCGRKIMEEAWLSNYQYVKLSDLGYIKGQTTVSEETINKIYNRIIHGDEDQKITHQHPVSAIQCDQGSCNMFQFMSAHVGLKVLHPGGKKSTYELINRLQLKKHDRVLEIACGKGRTAVHMAKKYGCQVIGVDILENSIDEAVYYAKKHGVDRLVSFRVANAMELPFGNQEFDVTLAQAMLILVDDKVKVTSEATRVLKNGGRSGWLEISWKKQPTQDFIQAANKDICAACISNAETFEGWEELFRLSGYKSVNTLRYNMDYRGMAGMMKDEGLYNGLKIMSRFFFKSHIRKRMNRLNNFFRSYPDYTGYGIYLATKQFKYIV